MEISPGAPDEEGDLQALIAEYPRLIGNPEDALMLVRRKHDIPNQQDGAGRWSIDHVFVSRSAVPVLVEAKRATDTRLPREVVGQMLDYAANGVTYWPAGTLREQFEKRVVQVGGDPETQLALFLGEVQEMAGFWSQLIENGSSSAHAHCSRPPDLPARSEPLQLGEERQLFLRRLVPSLRSSPPCCSRSVCRHSKTLTKVAATAQAQLLVTLVKVAGRPCWT